VTRYVALLRGINVGGKNLIPMARLRACFEAQGYDEVATYIASGNVLFSCADEVKEAAIEKQLTKTFGYEATIVLLTHRQLARVRAAAPRGFGSRPEQYRYDVWFLKPPLTAKQALPHVPTREGVDEVSLGPGVLYCTRLVAKATQSRLSKVIGTPIYKQLTIRNWNTTVKLDELLARP
jgi:uncharacterized protein (DUF1697 family)